MNTISPRPVRTIKMNAAARAAYYLLHQLGVPVTRTGIESAWERGHSRPSLYTIARQLNRWRVPHICLQVEAEALGQLPCPFIAHLTADKGRFLVITSLHAQGLRYIDEEGAHAWMTQSDFLWQWSGHVLLAEKTAHSGETDFHANARNEARRKTRVPVAVGVGLLLCTLGGLAGSGFATAVLLLLKTTGWIVSALLLLAEMDKEHPLAKAFCTRGGDCTSVVKSARAAGGMGWSEAGLLYFGTGFFCLLFAPALSLLPWMNAAALLFIPYSLYLQKFKIRAWCPLCLTVLTVFILEAITHYFYWRNGFEFVIDGHGLVSLFLSATLAGLLLLLLRAALRDGAHATQYRKQFHRLKYDPAVFRALLEEQDKLRAPATLGITIGPADAVNTIIQVCHPYCRPCGVAHRVLEELMAARQDLRIQIIFTSTTEKDDISARPVQHFLALYNAKDPLLPQALADWYAKGCLDYEGFVQRYPALRPEAQRDEVDAMDRWCRAAAIAFTPTLFVNGRRLPALYRVEDLRYLLDE